MRLLWCSSCAWLISQASALTSSNRSHLRHHHLHGDKVASAPYVITAFIFKAKEGYILVVQFIWNMLAVTIVIHDDHFEPQEWKIKIPVPHFSQASITGGLKGFLSSEHILFYFLCYYLDYSLLSIIIIFRWEAYFQLLYLVPIEWLCASFPYVYFQALLCRTKHWLNQEKASILVTKLPLWSACTCSVRIKTWITL